MTITQPPPSLATKRGLWTVLIFFVVYDENIIYDCNLRNQFDSILVSVNQSEMHISVRNFDLIVICISHLKTLKADI